jgi:hypothetical protein
LTFICELQALGDVVRQRLDVDLARDVLEHAALLGPRRVLAAEEVQRHDRVDGHVEIHAQEVDVHRVPADGVTLGVLQHRGGGVPAELQLDHRAARGQRVAQLALVDGEGERVVAAAVEDAGHLAFTAQAAGGTRVGDLAFGDGELRGLTGHGRRRMVAPRRPRAPSGGGADLSTTIEGWAA